MAKIESNRFECIGMSGRKHTVIEWTTQLSLRDMKRVRTGTGTKSYTTDNGASVDLRLDDVTFEIVQTGEVLTKV